MWHLLVPTGPAAVLIFSSSLWSSLFSAVECGGVYTGRVNSVFPTLVDMLMGHEEMGTEIMRERKYPGLFRNNLLQDNTFSFY